MDATTRVRDEASRTLIREFAKTSPEEVAGNFEALAEQAAATLDAEGVPRSDQTTEYQVDIRYHGQGLLLTVDVDLAELRAKGLDAIGNPFDETHRQLFTFALELEKEVVNLRAVVQGKPTVVKAAELADGGADPSAAVIAEHQIFVEDKDQAAKIFDRGKLQAGNRIPGPAIVMEMDSTTLVLPGHTGEVDKVGNILIRPD